MALEKIKKLIPDITGLCLQDYTFAVALFSRPSSDIF